jgi:cell division protein ZapA (FtsZ GTPase activity inhibitor)
MSEQPEKNKRISVSIGGISYQLISRENESYAREIARKADDAIHQILSQHPSLSTTQAIVLAMVNTFDALTKLGHSLDETNKEIEQIEERASKEIQNAQFNMTKAQHELFSLRDTDFELKKEIVRVNELNKQLELEIASLQKNQNIKHTKQTALKSKSDEGASIERDDAADEKKEDITDEWTNDRADVRADDGEALGLQEQNPDDAADTLKETCSLPDEPEIDEDESKEEPFGSMDRYDEADKLRKTVENDAETENLLYYQDDGEDVEYTDEPLHPGNPEDGLFTAKENEFIQEANRKEESFEGYKQTSLEDYFV